MWFKNNYTKWIPLGNFNFAGTDFIVFVRGDKKTGLMDFKVKSVNHRIGGCQNPIFPGVLIEVRKQWDTIIEMMNE